MGKEQVQYDKMKHVVGAKQAGKIYAEGETKNENKKQEREKKHRDQKHEKTTKSQHEKGRKAKKVQSASLAEYHEVISSAATDSTGQMTSAEAVGGGRKRSDPKDSEAKRKIKRKTDQE